MDILNYEVKSSDVEIEKKYLAVLVFVLIGAAFSFSVGEQEPADPYCGGCNVLFISIDTLRADHLGAYGYERNTSPNIDSIAEKGVLFENVYSQSSHTLASHFSIFTSLYPRTHHVRAEAPIERGFSEDFRMLAEVLNESAYSTVSYNGGSNVRGSLGFRRGFDIYRENYVRQSVNPRGNLDNATEIVEKQLENSSEPFFMFLHTFKVHDPYHPPENYASMFEGFNRSIREKANSKLREMQKENSTTADAYFRWKYVAPRMRNSSEWREHMIASYDADIRYTDHVIGQVEQILREKGIRDETVIVITSDHGEQFGEHGSWYHGLLYEEETHVPLIIDIPGRDGGRKEDIAASVDIAPTLLDILRISDEEFAQQKQGVSLLNVIKGGERRKKFIAQSHYTNQTALINTWKGLKYYRSGFRVKYDNGTFYRAEGFERMYRFRESNWTEVKASASMDELSRLNRLDFDTLEQIYAVEEKLKNLGYVQ